MSGLLEVLPVALIVFLLFNLDHVTPGAVSQITAYSQGVVCVFIAWLIYSAFFRELARELRRIWRP